MDLRGAPQLPASADEPQLERAIFGVPPVKGGFHRLRSETLAQMSKQEADHVVVEYYGRGRAEFILQAMSGRFSSTRRLFESEQRALMAGSPQRLAGEQRLTVEGQMVLCDQAVMPANRISMCVLFRDGFAIVGSGLDLSIQETAALVVVADQTL